jgi:hypothetical protein
MVFGVVAGPRSDAAAVCFLTLGTAMFLAVCTVPDTSKGWVAWARVAMRQQTAAILTRPGAHPQEVSQAGRRRDVLADERFRGLQEEGRNGRVRAGPGLWVLQRRWWVRWVRCGYPARTLLSRSCVAELDWDCISTDSGTGLFGCVRWPAAMQTTFTRRAADNEKQKGGDGKDGTLKKLEPLKHIPEIPLCPPLRCARWLRAGCCRASSTGASPSCRGARPGPRRVACASRAAR